jgi:MFS transporter, MHS family, citrate/tricarballylate:H+ symporter
LAEIVLDEIAPQGAATRALPVSQVLAVGVGNALEFYDFLTFSFFAVQIGRAFFPAGSHGLLYSLATFGAGFLTRPLGGVVIGGLGDRVGRKPAMLLSFALMGCAIVALALIPSYTRIGVAAPVLLVICRLVQGFALGGEVGPSTAFLVEAAPPHRRGLYVAMQYMTQDAAVLVAGIVGFTLSNLLSPAALDAWGWRAAFLLGAAVVPVGLVLRRTLPETLHDPEPARDQPRAGRAPLGLVVRALALLGATGIYFYGVDYITTYAQDSLRMGATAAFGATVMVGLFAVLADPVAGWLSDRVGRRPVALVALALLLVGLVPAYLVMIHVRSVPVVYGVAAWLAVMEAFMAAPVLVMVTEALPKAVRSRGLATVYAAAMALFGGTAQFVIKWLTDTTGSRLAPAWYMSAALAIGAVAMLLARETAPLKTER